MIFGLGDAPFPDDPPSQSPSEPSVDLLDSQIASLKLEIKTIEKEIQAHQAARQIDQEATTEKKQKEIADLTRQVTSFQRALEHEQKRIQHFQTEVARREGKLAEQQQLLAAQPDSEYYEEQVVALKSQNEQLAQELKELHREIANEAGEDFDIDDLLQSGGSEMRKRADELQRLQAEFAKLQGQAVDGRIKQSIERAADRNAQEADQLLSQKADLEAANETMRNKIKRTRAKCDSLEEASRALRMMDVLLTEKLAHDKGLIEHLEEFQASNAESLTLPEPETPPVTYEIVEQLRTQQMIIEGLFYKLGLAQKELSTYTVPDSFQFLVDQLDQLQGRCQMLQGNLLRREAAETQKIEGHIGED
jgi:chromosome segregation ATPase